MIREKSHRLPPESYRGLVKAAFTICTAKRLEHFNCGAIVAIAIHALEEAFIQHGGHAAVYLFMPDHVHLIVSGKDTQSDLLALVERFKQKTTFRVRRAGGDFAWQKDFYDHIIRASEDYGVQVRYLLRNPVRRGLCAHWEHWPNKGVLGQTWEDLAVNIGSL
jgi:putative transposase